ncbi:MAG: MBL fold metallo-hydrolase [Candidatus Eremiobacteraeota bacterium]|nr:MBL fold metallo-hydrolase [Candidatus Eremiobacteraeota bacterium]
MRVWARALLLFWLTAPAWAGGVTIQWLGHSCFLIVSPGGTRVLTDPYPPMLGYSTTRVAADLVTISIDEFDHSHVAMAEGRPRVLHGLTLEGEWTEVRTECGDVKVRGIGAWQDDSHGKERGKNGMFLFETGGLRILHVGNLGHQLSDEQLEKIGRVDVLLVPVGGIYTLDGNQAAALTRKVAPRVAIPMHYKTPALVFDLQTNEKYLRNFPKYQSARKLSLEAAKLPAATTVYVLDFRP